MFQKCFIDFGDILQTLRKETNLCRVVHQAYILQQQSRRLLYDFKLAVHSMPDRRDGWSTKIKSLALW